MTAGTGNRRIRRSRATLGSADFRGPDDVVFLPTGGMAFTCGPLWFFRNAAQKSATELEPATANPRSLGLAHGSDSFVDRLYWTLGDGSIKSLDLG